ncbi:hypothetical protein [Streptomyces sp. DH-12]|uniref:hypothetical protein n=1 Tax=unclassified Streptomyces TaxID=2593676 RepID=UPI00313DB374
MFADRPCDAPSMDDIARRARVAEGLIPCCFHSERGCCPAITEDSAAGPVAPAASGDELPPVERVRRTVGSCLRYAEHHRAARRAIGGDGTRCLLVEEGRTALFDMSAAIRSDGNPRRTRPVGQWCGPMRSAGGRRTVSWK